MRIHRKVTYVNNRVPRNPTWGPAMNESSHHSHCDSSPQRHCFCVSNRESIKLEARINIRMLASTLALPIGSRSLKKTDAVLFQIERVSAQTKAWPIGCQHVSEFTVPKKDAALKFCNIIKTYSVQNPRCQHVCARIKFFHRSLSHCGHSERLSVPGFVY